MDVKNRVVGLLNNILSTMDGGLPKVEATTNSLHSIGESIINYTPRFNEFTNALVNKIFITVLRSKSYKSHYGVFDKGTMALGATINEIYNDLCDVHGFDPDTAYQTIFQLHKLPVQAAFHSVNIRAQYDLSIGREELAQAFTSFEGLDEYIQNQIARLWTSLEYDKEQLFKYTLAIAILDGKVKAITIDAPAAGTADASIVAIKKVGDYMGYMSPNYNMAKVRNFTENGELYVLTSVDFDAVTDVYALAKAFNLEKDAFIGHRVQFDSFGNIDSARLAKILDKDSGYVDLTSTQLGYLNKIHAIVCDKNFPMFYTTLLDMGEVRVVNGLYNNYTLNYWAILSMSPFENAAIFTDQASSVTSVTISGLDAISMAGVYDYSATVTTVGFAEKTVKWKVEAGTASSITKVSIDNFGRLTIKSSYATGTIVITATSTADGTVVGTKTVTLS
ncbi:MAG: hypothetical protein IKS76_01530 [Paludibacteraceae bacterium]|nr:hypothetical protein [Paludibacteraceae bacterium]